MYYLQSRYYDPEIGRFINADAYASTGQGFLGCNMFAYCGNDPVNRIDSTGERQEAIDLSTLGGYGGLGLLGGILIMASVKGVWDDLTESLRNSLEPIVLGAAAAVKNGVHFISFEHDEAKEIVAELPQTAVYYGAGIRGGT